MAMSKKEREEVIALIFGKTNKEPQKSCCECYERGYKKGCIDGYKKGCIDGYNECVDEQEQTADEITDNIFNYAHTVIIEMFGNDDDKKISLTPLDLHDIINVIHRKLSNY